MPVPRVIEQPTTTNHLAAGINVIADLLAATLGPVSGPVANERDHQRKPEWLDDSSTVVRRILNMADPDMDVGAMTMRSLVWRVVQRAGDGGATAAVLARAIYEESTRLVAAGISSVMLAKGIEAGVEAAAKSLEKMSRPVTTEDELAHVARTIIGDPELSAVLGEMSYILGADAHVSVEKYVAQYLQQFYHPGAHIRAEIGSMYFYTDPTQKRAVVPQGRIAIVDKRLDSVDEVIPILEAALKSGAKALTVVAWNFSEEVLGLLMKNSRTSNTNIQTNGAGVTNGNGDGSQNETNSDADKKEEAEKDPRQMIIIGIQPKAVGDERRFLFDDMAVMTGGTVLGREFSTPPSMATVDDLGEALRCEFGGGLLHVVPMQQQTVEVQQRAAELRTRLNEMTLDDEERPVLVKRLSALSGGMGVLKVGAESKLDREVRAKNAERTMKVLSAAQHGGIAPGGGAAFVHCIPALAEVEAEGEVAMGVQVVARALEAPLRQILDNAQVPSSSVIIERVKDAGSTATYDAISGEVVNAFDAGILDVVPVMATALRTAASSAAMSLSTDVIVYHKKPQQSMSPDG